MLYDDLAFEVRWAVAGESIVIQLVAKLGNKNDCICIFTFDWNRCINKINENTFMQYKMFNAQMMVNICPLAYHRIAQRHLWLVLMLLLHGLIKILEKAMLKIITLMQKHNVPAIKAVARIQDSE